MIQDTNMALIELIYEFIPIKSTLFLDKFLKYIEKHYLCL